MTTQAKVIIPREVAEEIEHLRSGVGYGKARDNEGICEFALRRDMVPPTVTQILREIPFDTLLSALVNGYEIELTEEERREKAYAAIHAFTDKVRETPYVTPLGAIRFTLNALGIVIPGVNDEGGAA